MEVETLLVELDYENTKHIVELEKAAAYPYAFCGKTGYVILTDKYVHGVVNFAGVTLVVCYPWCLLYVNNDFDIQCYATRYFDEGVLQIKYKEGAPLLYYVASKDSYILGLPPNKIIYLIKQLATLHLIHIDALSELVRELSKMMTFNGVKNYFTTAAPTFAFEVLITKHKN